MSDILPAEPCYQSSPQLSPQDVKFDLSPDTKRGKYVITFYGMKGDSKTYSALALALGYIGGFSSNGKVVAFSFDNKTKITKEQHFNECDITVYDGKRYYNEDPKVVTKSGKITYLYLQSLLENIAKQQPVPEWIVFDGFNVQATILEMAMRFDNNLRYNQGIANFNLWKDRSLMIQFLHNTAMRIARRGVIYTCYTDKNKVVHDGTVITEEDVPKYVDIVMQETDIVIRTQKVRGKNGNLFYLRVDSTKFKQYIDEKGNLLPVTAETLSEGRTFDITDIAVRKKPQPTLETFAQPKPEEKQEVKHDTTKDIPKETDKQDIIIAPGPVEPVVTPPVQLKTEEQKPKFVIPDLMSL